MRDAPAQERGDDHGLHCTRWSANEPPLRQPRSGRHTFLLYQVENDARIEFAAAAAHRQTIECGEAHGRRHALAPMHRAYACAAAEVGDHYATIGFCQTKDVRKDAGDVFVGKPMKSVSPDTLGGEPTRKREGSGDLRLSVMERGVEARDLREEG